MMEPLEQTSKKIILDKLDYIVESGNRFHYMITYDSSSRIDTLVFRIDSKTILTKHMIALTEEYLNGYLDGFMDIVHTEKRGGDNDNFDLIRLWS